MKLNVPVLSQRDPRWKDQRLGTVDGTTIGGYGCIITCMTMMANYYGHNLTPADMDNWLTDNKGYTNGFGGYSPQAKANLYVNEAFGREFTDCKFEKVIFCQNIPAPLTEIDSALSQGHPVVIMVDFDHDLNDGIQTHFVLIVGRQDDGTYIINDPWFGDQVFLTARYGSIQAQLIQQINLFSGPAPIHFSPSASVSPSASLSPSSSPSKSVSPSSSVSSSLSPSGSVSASPSPTQSISDEDKLVRLTLVINSDWFWFGQNAWYKKLQLLRDILHG